MAVDIGTVREQELTKNKDGDDNVRLLQVELSNPDDLQTVEQIRQSGDDSNPQPGSRVIVLDLGASYRVAIAVDDGVEPSVDPGEKELYSYDDSLVKQAQIKLAVDGTITINNGSATVEVDTSGNVTVTASKLILNSEADAVGLASKIDLLWSTLDTLFRTTWTPVPNDGGAALKAAYVAAFAAPPATVASTKMKLDA